jgi:hypothetical protein
MNKKHEETKDLKIFLITFRKVKGAPVIAIKWQNGDLSIYDKS